MTELTVTTGSVTSSARVTVRAVTACANRTDRPQSIPFAIPRSQLYYWTSEWQRGEAEAMDDVQHGRSQEFDNFVDLAKYLLGPDEG